MCYYFRLPQNLRNDFESKISTKFKFFKNFKTKIENILKDFYEKKIKLPKGVAKTKSLMENLFCISICLQAKIPIVIIGNIFNF